MIGGDCINIKINELSDLKLLSHMNIISKILLITLRINLYKKIGQKKYTIADLAELVNCYPDRLKRILDLLVDIGLIVYENGEYSNSKIAYKYLNGFYNQGLKDNISYFLHEEELLNYISKSQIPNPPHGKETVREYLERMDFNSRYSAYCLWKKLKPSGEKYLLDVGCGSGIFSFIMCQYNKYIHADCIDQNEVITIINEKIKEKELEDRISTRICNIKNEDFTNGNTYDYILMSNILHFLSSNELDKALRLSYTALRKDAKLIISDVFPVKDDIETLCYSFMWMQDTNVLLLEKDVLLNKLSNYNYRKIETFKMENTPSTFIIAQK